MNKKSNITLGKVVVGGFWLYLDAILVSFIGYVYWLLIARIAGPSVLGYASATTSFASIIQSSITFGIPIGVQRFLGKAFGESNYEMLKKYFFSAFLFLFSISTIITITVFTFSRILADFVGLDAIYIILASLLVFFTVIKLIFRSFLISILRVNRIFVFDIIANIGRLFLGIYFVILGYEGVGAVMGYVFSGFISVLLFGLYSFKLLYSIKSNQPFLDFSAIKDSLKTGVVSWLPGLISTFGVQSGIIVLFGSSGAVETGIYFIAYAIFGVLWAIPTTFLGILFPVLSGLKEGHERSTQRALNLVLAISTPLAIATMIYSDILLSFVSPTYATGWFVLAVLVISIPFSCIINSVNSFAYALGEYKIVLLIGGAMSLSRVLLYFALVPSLASLGAAYAFDVGVLISFFIALAYSKKSNLSISLNIFTLVFLTSTFFGLILWGFNIPWYLGTLILFAICELIFARKKIYTRRDIHDIALALFSKNIIMRLAPIASPILKILFGE